MYTIMKQNDKTGVYVTEYVADSAEDVKNLPTNVAPGSICIVIDGSRVFMLNNSQEWKEL